MAEDADPESKTEEPSEKRLRDAAEKGNIARSQEIGHWFIFLAAILAIWMLGGSLTRHFTESAMPLLEQPHLIPIDAPHLTSLATDLMMGIGLALAPILGLFSLFGLAGNVLQNPPHFNAEKLMPDLNKLNPMSGLQRIFSVSSLVEFLKNLLKIGVIGALLVVIIRPELDSLEALVDLDLAVVLPYTFQVVGKLLMALLGIMAVVAGADYLYQRYSHNQKLRMTKQEVKDEHKESEGDPLIKARLRQIRMQRVRQRMMAAVPQASVVVTNPTHYAVALKYELGQMEAPMVVAKGADLLAKRIREIAGEHEVPIIEAPPLARALYLVEIDEPIPVEHYKAVAEVISFVMKLKEGGKSVSREPQRMAQ